MTVARYVARAFAFLCGTLHLSPAAAWSTSVVELELIWRGHTEATHGPPRPMMTRARHEELKALYPD